MEIMTREASSGDLKELVQKFVPEAMGREIEKASRGIYPLANGEYSCFVVSAGVLASRSLNPPPFSPVLTRKCKILKAPKYDSSKLLELHAGSTEETGTKVATEVRRLSSLSCVARATED